MNVWTIAKIGVKETLRRPLALFLVFLLPMVFYLVRLDVQWQAIRLLAIGVGWAVATLSLFSGVVSSQLDRRLCVMGARPSVLFAGRHIAQAGIGLAVSGVYFAVVATTQDVVHISAVGLLLVTTVLVSVPLGALMSFAVARELEGGLRFFRSWPSSSLWTPTARRPSSCRCGRRARSQPTRSERRTPKR